MKTSLINLIIVTAVLFSGCRKETLPSVITVDISMITVNSAECGGNITSDGGADIIERGVCWSENENPTIADNITNNGSGSGTYTSKITGLKPGTKYYLKAYARNSVGTQYGKEISFSTLGAVPGVSNLSAGYLRLYGGVLLGYINPSNLPTLVTFEYGRTTSYGTSVAPSPYPINGPVPIGISVTIDNLSPGTLYHFRIKAENELGISYSADQTFSTLGEKPSFTATVQSSLTTSTAVIGINVNANLLPVSVVLEYGTTESLGNTAVSSDSPVNVSNPTIVNTALTGLSAGTKYFFRLKLSNEVGSVYTSVNSFKTYNVMDADNNGYYTVTIGTQEWMTSNLKTTRFSNSDPIPKVTDNWSSQTSPAYCFYNNQASVVPLEGNLYNYYVAVDSRNVCPSGWHVPSKDEWATLIDQVGGIPVAGPELRHASTAYWYTTTVSSNSSGFSAIGSGARIPSGDYWGSRHAAIFWATTSFIYDPTYKYRMIIYGDRPEVELSTDLPVSGYSIRCLKD